MDAGAFTYSVKSGYENLPVMYVSHLDAQRFANWMHNGQGAGDTETGAYTVGAIAVHSGVAQYWIPTEDEWYKAAYYQPASMGGDTDSYWLYPTKSNTIPTIATAGTTGDISNPGANVVNYGFGADWNGQDGNVTTVGSAGPLSASYYGTYDQGGNVREWNEGIVTTNNRSVRGGPWNSTEELLRASNRNGLTHTIENSNIGFRLASSIPEPSRATFLLASGCTLLLRRRRSPARN